MRVVMLFLFQQPELRQKLVVRVGYCYNKYPRVWKGNEDRLEEF